MFLENISELSRCSNKKVSVVCDYQESELCLGKVIRMYMNVRTNINKNNGMYVCPQRSRLMHRLRQSGRNHSRCKYKNLDDHLMDIIDSDAKAYLLGWIASDGNLNVDGCKIRIAIKTCDVGVLETLRNFICPDLPIANHTKGTMKSLCICSTQWSKAIQKHLNLSFEKGESHKKSHLVQMPAEISDTFKWSFLRGLFEGDGCILIIKDLRTRADNLRVSITSSSLAMRMMIVTFCREFNINISMSSTQVLLSGQYAARFLEKVYAECDGKFILKRKYDVYKKLKLELSRFWNRAAVAEEAYIIAKQQT